MPFFPPVGGNGTVQSITGQTSNAVNNTDPDNPIIKNATASNAGTMSASSFIKLTDLDYDEWFKSVVDIMHAQAPALTNFKEIPIGALPMGAINTVADDEDGLAVGGAIGNAAGAYKYFSTSIFQTPKTTSWGLAFKGKLTTPSGGNFAMLGLTDAAHSQLLGVASYGTGDATKYIIYTFDGQEVITVSSLAVANVYKSFVFTFDATTLKLYIDGTLRASTADLTGISDAPLYVTAVGTLAGDAKVQRCAYGYIVP